MSVDGDWKGGCQCGAVRYRFTKTASEPTICHCESCRRSAGAPMVAWITVRVDDVTFDGDDPRIYRSSESVERGFCGTCGTTLTYRHLDHAGYLDIATATLDDAQSLPPRDHIWTVDRLSWMEDADRLPVYERSRKG